MNRILVLSAALLLFPISLCSADEVFPVIHNEPIAVRVLDGKEGHPQSRVHVVLIAGYDRLDLEREMWREEALTDGTGVVHLSNELRNLPFLRVQILKRHACQPGSGRAAFSVERIRRDGLSGVNRCGAAVVEDAPGVFIVFVKAKKPAPPEPATTSVPQRTLQKQ